MNDTGRQIARAAEEAGALSERQQHILNSFKALLSGIPTFGSPLATLISDYIPSLKEQRMIWFVEDLKNDLERLAKAVDAQQILTEEYSYTSNNVPAGSRRTSPKKSEVRSAQYSLIPSRSQTCHSTREITTFRLYQISVTFIFGSSRC